MGTTNISTPWITLLGTAVALIAIALSLATARTDLGISFQLLPYFAAASLSAMLLGLVGRHRRENVWLCFLTMMLGAAGLAIDYTIFAAIIVAIVLLVAYVGDLSSIDWFLEASVGAIVVIFGLLLAGLSLPIILIGALIIGVLIFLSDLLDFF